MLRVMQRKLKKISSSLKIFERIRFSMKEPRKICSLGESIWNLRLKLITIKFSVVTEADTEGVKLAT